ncbi:MAG: thiamine biosynthesis protein ThiS [Thermoplasmata archaeon]
MDRRRVLLAPGSTIRQALAAVGAPPEGSAVLCDGVPQPLDAPIDRSVRLTVVPTFSGG